MAFTDILTAIETHATTAGAGLTNEQEEWLDRMAEHIATSLAI